MKLQARSAGPLTGNASIPGDKSCSHRALILAAMAEGRSRITNLLDADDVRSTIKAIEALGAEVSQSDDGGWIVHGGPWKSPDAPIDCGNSGTTARLLMGAVAGRPVTARFIGDQSLSARPMRRVTGPLQRMGARIEGDDRLPISVHGGPLGGIEHHNHPASAQVKSAILFAGLGSRGPVRIKEPVPSRDHSEIILRQFGCDVRADGGIVELGERRQLRGCDIAIAADPSSAAFPLTAAAIVPGSSITVRDMLANPTRTGLVETLEEMGAAVTLAGERLQSGEIVADITVGHVGLRPVEVTADRIPAMIDEIPLLAVACAFAEGESVVHGLGELRHKESDRLGAIVAGLTACGVAAFADADSLRIFGKGKVRGGARVSTGGDHRIAMAFVTLGLGADEPVEVDRPEMIATSFPRFVETMRGLGANIA